MKSYYFNFSTAKLKIPFFRGAYKWWSESLDLLLGISDSIHGWRSLSKNTEDFSKVLLDRCGLWGCILGGIVCSNIAQYILTGDLGLRTECCFLSGFFFKVLYVHIILLITIRKY